MTVPTFIALIVAFAFLFISVCLLILIKKLEQRLNASKAEFAELQNKFQKNPSYECQQLLANLLNGHALFHIETIDPENLFIRRR